MEKRKRLNVLRSAGLINTEWVTHFSIGIDVYQITGMCTLSGGKMLSLYP